MSEPSSRRALYGAIHPWIFLAAIVVLSSAMGLRTMGAPKIHFGDGIEYLTAAYHLRHDHTYTQATIDSPAPPSLGREPGYSAVLAVLMALDPGVGGYKPSCQPSDPACDPGRYRALAYLNLVFIEVAGVLVFLVARDLTGLHTAGLAAAAYLLLDSTLMRFHWYDPMSDQLALLLVAAAMLALTSACKRAGSAAWTWVGLTLAGATLVKAAFLPFCLIASVAVLCRGARRGDGLKALVTAAVVYTAVTGGWIARNHHISGMARLTDNRGGIALSTREVFDHMTAPQFAAAFIYWTPDFGERLARALFAPDTIARFDLYAPGGFYDAGQNGYGRRVAALMEADGCDAWRAASVVDHQIVSSIVQAPLGFAVSTLPLLYRGLWIDQFGVFGLALLVWLAWFAAHQRRGPLLWIACWGLYNEVFYALVSLNIPRYQMTALPAVAIAAGVAVAEVRRRIGTRATDDRERAEVHDRLVSGYRE